MIIEFKDLVTSVDVLNTIYGGVSEPYVSFEENKEARQIRVRIPGVHEEAMLVEINNNELSICYMIPIESRGKLLQIPQVVHRQKLPYFIDANGVKANMEEEELVVKLPFNKRSNGYNRKVRIGSDPE